MGKQGPCCHCGVTSTPLWRNGPPEKPVLCNACGSRWRTKGTLLNYTPLHARADPADHEVHRAAGVKSISINKSKEVKLLKRKHASDNTVMNGGTPVDCHLGVPKFVEEDMSNRSSSGSAMSNSELQFESFDTSDLTGPAQSVVWDSMVPSRKRTCVNRLKQSSVEKLTKDLHAIMHEQQSSCFSGSSEEFLLFESSTPMCSSFEIGHGTVILRDPGSVAREEESEASSLSVDRKQCKASVSRAVNLPPNRGVKGSNFPSPSPRMEKNNTAEQGLGQEQPRRDISQHENLQILGNHNSALHTVNLKDVINIEEFMKHFTYEEEQQLLKYLPSGDNAQIPDSLKSLFDSSEFKENLSAFPQLVAEGFSSGSFSGEKVEDCCKTLKKLTLFSLMKRKEVESYHTLGESKNSSKSKFLELSTLHAMASSNLVGEKRPYDVQNQNFSEARMMMMSPKRPTVKGSCENKEFTDNDGSCFSPRRLLAFPPDGSALMLDSSAIVEENSDHDLLLNVPSNSSFPQAELLHPALSSGSHSHQASTSSSSVHHNLLHPR